MTNHIQIPDVTPVIRYAANGTQTIFTYPFPIFKDEDLIVFIDGAAQNSGYGVTGAGQTQGGTVVFVVAPASGAVVTLKRQLVFERMSDFLEGGDFAANVINTELDFLTASLQQLDNDTASILRFSDAENPPSVTTLPLLASRANHALGFDSAGNPVAYPVVSVSPPPVVDVTVTSGVSRTINGRANDFVSIKDFGAVGNGLANDTNAFTLALAAHQSVFVPKGVYLISGTITLGAGQSLVGLGNASIIRAQSSTFTAIEIVAGNTQLESLRIEQAQLGVRVFGRDAAATYNTINNVVLDQCASGLELDGFTNTARPCQSNNITGVTIIKHTVDGIRLITSGAGLAPARNNFERVTIDPQSATTTGNAIFIGAGIEQNSFRTVFASITGSSTACIRLASGVSGTLFEGLRLNAGAAASHIRLESGSVNTIIQDMQTLGAGAVLDDLSGGNYSALNAGATDKNRLLRTSVSDITAQLLRYPAFSYTASGTVNANAAYSTHLVSAAAGNVTFQLPNAVSVANTYIIVKKSEGSTNTVTITDHTGAQLEARALILTGWMDSVTVFSNGTAWHVITSPSVARGVRLSSASGTYDVDMLSDVYILTAASVARLPHPSNFPNRTVSIKKTTSAGATLTLTALSSGLIDGASSYDLTGDKSGIMLASDGSQWRVLSRSN